MDQKAIKKTAFGDRSYFDYNGALQSGEHRHLLINHLNTFAPTSSFEIIDSKTGGSELKPPKYTTWQRKNGNTGPMHKT